MEKEATFEESIRFEEFPVLNESDEILALVDEARRSHPRSLHRNLRVALPNAATVGFTGTPILGREKTETREIFGDFIDKYPIRDAELDGATVPILYEGRTADGLVKDAPSLDQLFEDMFLNYSEEDLAVIKAKHGTPGDVPEAPLPIEQKTKDMLRHCAGVVLPEGCKARVVAAGRRAAVVYREKLPAARDELVEDIEAVPAATLALPDHEIERLDRETRFLVRVRTLLPLIGALDAAVVVSGNHNDPESWRDWTNKEKQDEYTKRFKRKLAVERTEKTDPLARDLDPRVQVPFVRLFLEACSEGRDPDDSQRKAAIAAPLDIVERVRQEVAKVGFWKNPDRRELLAKQIVRDLDASGVCPPGKKREIAQRLVALAKENHQYLAGK